MPPPKDRPQMVSELIRLAETLAAPIDFDRLIAEGILREAGEWYEVLAAA